MLDEREALFADSSCGRLESVELFLPAAHKLLLSVVFDSLRKSSETFQYNEGPYQLFHRADADQNCKLVPCADNAFSNALN